MLNAPKGQAEMQASHPVHVPLSINNVAICVFSYFLRYAQSAKRLAFFI
jgi:hypothetical protein